MIVNEGVITMNKPISYFRNKYTQLMPPLSEMMHNEIYRLITQYDEEEDEIEIRLPRVEIIIFT